MCVRLHTQESENWDRVLQQLQVGNCVHNGLWIGRITKKKAIQMDNMGEFFLPYLTPRILQRKVAIPRDALRPLICFYPLDDLYEPPRCSLSGKDLVVLGFMNEINLHLLVIDHGHSCKSVVAIILPLPVEWEFDPSGIDLYLLGIRFPHHCSPHVSHPLDSSIIHRPNCVSWF